MSTPWGKREDTEGVALVTFVRGPARPWQIAATRPSAAREVPAVRAVSGERRP